MASPFRIPRKKGPSGSPPLPRLSPLARLQSAPPPSQGYGRLSGPGTRVPPEGPAGSSAGMIKYYCRNSPSMGLDSGDDSKMGPGRSGPFRTNGPVAQPRLAKSRQRHKRASDQMLGEGSSPATIPPKKKWGETATVVHNKSDSSAASRVEAGGERHAGTASSSKATQTCCKTEKWSSDDGLMSPPRKSQVRPAASSVSEGKGRPSPSGSRGGGLLSDDVRERQRTQWLAFKEMEKLSLKKSDTIVVSSSEDEEPRPSLARFMNPNSTWRKLLMAPASLSLDFLMLHMGQNDARSRGPLKVTELGIHVRLKGCNNGEEADVTVEPSQLRGYGLWDGRVAKGGTLLRCWRGPTPSLLFLWVTDERANRLQAELFDVCWDSPTSPSCSFLLFVLKEQLQGMQAAQLASILDTEAYRRGRACVSSPLTWTDGLLLVHTCPPPMDQHFLKLLGYPQYSRLSSTHKRMALQQPSTRLIQYPKAPCKGSITVTKDDVLCLNDGECLNDVIIDFYLKYLLLDGVGGAIARRSHVFSSFFFKQLSRPRVAHELIAPFISDRLVKHHRVKTWTRNVDIFTKDFLIIPINRDSHWFLVVVCHHGLQDSCYEDFKREGKHADQSSRGMVPMVKPPECTLKGWTKDKVLKRPCILVMDSLMASHHEDVCRLIRDYLEVEWEVQRMTPRCFSYQTMRSFDCKVPQQSNKTDCGIYLLQFAHSFLQNPVVHFDLPLQLAGWFPQQQVRQKRDEIRRLIRRLKDEAS